MNQYYSISNVLESISKMDTGSLSGWASAAVSLIVLGIGVASYRLNKRSSLQAQENSARVDAQTKRSNSEAAYQAIRADSQAAYQSVSGPRVEESLGLLVGAPEAILFLRDNYDEKLSVKSGLEASADETKTYFEDKVCAKNGTQFLAAYHVIARALIEAAQFVPEGKSEQEQIIWKSRTGYLYAELDRILNLLQEPRWEFSQKVETYTGVFKLDSPYSDELVNKALTTLNSVRPETAEKLQLPHS